MPDDNRLLVETNPTPGRRAGFLAQHRVKGTLYNEPTEGQNGHQSVRSDDGQFATFGATTDAESTTGNGTFIAILKRIRTLLSGVLNVQLSGSNVADVIFHDAVSATGNGLIYSVAGYKTLTVEIYGTSTGRQINFMARGPAGADRPITGLRISDLATDTGTTGTAEIWQFDIAGLVSVLCPIASVAGGNVSVRGRVVA